MSGDKKELSWKESLVVPGEVHEIHAMEEENDP